jgi:hemolysin activation/secretion protein
MRLPDPKAWLLACSLCALPLAAPAQDASAGASEPRFDVWEFAVSGNTLLEQQAVERAVYPFLGPGRTVADVERARQALEVVYKDAGFGTVAVNIPEQDVAEGLVALEVVEGRVERLLVTGTRYFSPAELRAAVPSLAAGQVPDLKQVQRELVAVNAASSDRRVTPVLRPGRATGTLEAELQVDDDLPLHGSFEVNDQYTRDTTRTRIAASLSYGNLWQRQHAVSLGYQTAPENTDDVEVLYGTYSARLADSAWLFSGYLVDSDTAVSTVGTLGVIGKGQIAGMRFIRPLPAVAGGLPRFTLGFDYKSFDESIALTGNQPTIETPIDYGVMSAGWAIVFPGEGRSTSLNAQLTVGPRFFGNDTAEFDNKRRGASAGFAHLNLGLQHERSLLGDWRIQLGLDGQLAGAPLISNEQFGIGGASTVRGYLESQAFMDNGYVAQFELHTPDWGRRMAAPLSGRLLWFIDLGGGNLRQAQAEQDDRFFLWSTGLGLRASLWKTVEASLDWAYPLKDSGNGNIAAGDARWHFSTSVGF